MGGLLSDLPSEVMSELSLEQSFDLLSDSPSEVTLEKMLKQSLDLPSDWQSELPSDLQLEQTFLDLRRSSSWFAVRGKVGLLNW